jgi:type II secretory pathway pseudopilin PulG
MKYVAIAIIGIVLVVAFAGVVLSQSKRSLCLQDCRIAGDECAQEAYRGHSRCAEDPAACETAKVAALKSCAQEYDSCRWQCDVPSF